MAEYIYLLENRLTPAQQHALLQVRDAAREAGTTVFLTGGAVRDLTTGSSVRNLDFTVQGNALTLEKGVVARGGELWGTHEPTRTLSLWFPGSVRVQIASARTEQYPKPGKPVYTWSSIVDDLRRRDFTANAMALSLNEGSYGLLLDPLNGVADIEARLLRLASNYGFLEEPSRLVRAARLLVRLGWQMDEKTATRYGNAKEAESIKSLSGHLRGYELEKIASEEDALVILKALEAEGWMQHLFPAWTSAQADLPGLESLRRNWIQLLMQGVSADLTAVHLELLTARLNPKDVEALKKVMVHPGLIRQWEGLEESAKEFGRQLTGKAATTPSATWKLLTTHAAEPILWLASTRKTGAAGGAVDAKFKNFFTVWPEFKKRIPAALMLEMRITPELPGYEQLLEQLFYEFIDGNLETDELLRAFLEPYSPPAPPPPPTLRRSRAKKSESKTRRRTVAPDDEDEDEHDDAESDADADEVAAVDEDEEEVEEAEDPALVSSLRKLDLEAKEADDADESDDTDTDEDGEDSAVPPGGSGGKAIAKAEISEAPVSMVKPGAPGAPATAESAGGVRAGRPVSGSAVSGTRVSGASAAANTPVPTKPTPPSPTGAVLQSAAPAVQAKTPAKAAAAPPGRSKPGVAATKAAEARERHPAEVKAEPRQQTQAPASKAAPKVASPARIVPAKAVPAKAAHAPAKKAVPASVAKRAAPPPAKKAAKSVGASNGKKKAAPAKAAKKH